MGEHQTFGGLEDSGIADLRCMKLTLSNQKENTRFGTSSLSNSGDLKL